MLRWVRKWFRIKSERGLRAWLAALTFTILILKLLIIRYPWPELPPEACITPPHDTGCAFIFDEAHYIPAVRKMLGGEAVNNEHPPLSKFLMMAGVIILGDNPYGWRALISLCGAASIYLLGLLAYRLTNSFKASIAAAALFGLDITSFNLSSIAMLDAPALMFSLMGANLYLRRRLAASGLFFGLALLSKLSASFILLAILLYELARLAYEEPSFRELVRKWVGVLERVGFVAVITLILGLAAYDYAYGAFQTPLEHLDYMLNYHSSLTFSENDAVDMPLSWTNPLFQFPRRNYFVVTVQVDSIKTYHPIAYYGMQTPLWWMTWVVLFFSAYLAYTGIRAGGFPKLEIFTILWLFTNYLIYFPLAHILHRWVYPFYFYNSVPAVAMAISRFLEGDRLSEAVLYMLVAGQLCFFLYFFPVKAEWFIDFLLWLGLPA